MNPRLLILILCLCSAPLLRAQQETTQYEEWDDARMEKYMKHRRDSLRQLNLRQAIGDVLLSGYERGIYLGAVGQFEMKTGAAGGELKLYDSYYTPYYSGSVYVNYRHLFVPEGSPVPSSCIGAGMHFTIFGLESNMYFGNDRRLWYIAPNLGVDYGNLRFFYGFQFPLGHNEFRGAYRHLVAVKYALYVSAYKHYASRKKSYRY